MRDTVTQSAFSTVAWIEETEIEPVVGKPIIEPTEEATADANVADADVISVAMAVRSDPVIVASTATEPELNVTLTALDVTLIFTAMLLVRFCSR